MSALYLVLLFKHLRCLRTRGLGISVLESAGGQSNYFSSSYLSTNRYKRHIRAICTAIAIDMSGQSAKFKNVRNGFLFVQIYWHIYCRFIDRCNIAILLHTSQMQYCKCSIPHSPHRCGEGQVKWKGGVCADNGGGEEERWIFFLTF